MLRKYDIRPKKRFGQNFLSEMPTISKIALSIEPSKQDTILEIGCGLGVLTALIAGRAGSVIAVEYDKELFEIAQNELCDLRNIIWINSDILKIGIADLCRESSYQKIKILGNLPYNISSPILFWMLDQRANVSKAVVMLQKEVAMRVIAKPGGKDYGIISVLIQAHARAKRLFDVAASNFIPPPKVVSSVIEIEFEHDRKFPCDEPFFRNLVKAAFGKRRKTIRNSVLSAANLKFSPEQFDLALKETGIAQTRRAETLSVNEYILLAEKLGN